MRAAILACLILASSSNAMAQSQDEYSANARLPGCRGFVSQTPSDFHQGICFGTIVGVSKVLSTTQYLCTPVGVTMNQMIRVVIRWIEARPQRMHESFAGLAAEALLDAWPCR